jgi:hypothetical protein
MKQRCDLAFLAISAYLAQDPVEPRDLLTPDPLLKRRIAELGSRNFVDDEIMPRRIWYFVKLGRIACRSRFPVAVSDDEVHVFKTV